MYDISQMITYLFGMSEKHLGHTLATRLWGESIIRNVYSKARLFFAEPASISIFVIVKNHLYVRNTGDMYEWTTYHRRPIPRSRSLILAAFLN